jgi:hypothetical protein
MKLRAQRNGPPCFAVLLLLDIRWGKRKLAVLLRREGIDVSVSRVGRILTRLIASSARADSGQPRALSTDALVLLLGSKSVTALVVMLIESAAELAEHLRAEADRYAANLAFEPEKSITCVSVPANG